MPDTSPPPTRRFTPTPVETTVKKSRRFAPEPVETTTRSSRKENEDMAASAAPPKRRFVPEPVETTFKSSKVHNPLPSPEPTPSSIPKSSPPSDIPKPRRKFTPELIETSKRSKKAGDAKPATLPTDKTDLTPGVPNIYTRSKRKSPRPGVLPVPSVPDNTPNASSINIHTKQITPFAPRRQGSMRPHLNTRQSTRQNSYQPELEAIPSEESQENSDEEDDEEGTPSLSGSLGSSEDSMMRLQLARTRESCDDRFSGYLLALAAKAAEKQLREQALAAFPNETFHEIVEHFYDREIDQPSDEEAEGIGLLVEDRHIPPRRQSTEVGWAAKEMQEHQEKLNRLREQETNQKIADEATKPTFKDPFWTNGMTTKNAAFARTQDKNPISKAKEAELDRMRLAASPPMLGSDLKFRLCPSPKATKFESDQRIDVQAPCRSEDGGGLWGGYCVAEEPGALISPSSRGPPLIQTPHPERDGPDDPFSSAFASSIPNGSGARSPKSNGQGAGVRMLAGIDERLKAEVAKSKQEQALVEEFDDAFVTQVYNYLSLGYPVLARPYDDELARISRIAPDDLRADDHKQNAKGHIGLVDAPGAGAKCARWKALRIYILEWGRQNPDMASEHAGPNAWGVRARRGSWAI
ncbi:hypothetical protein LSUE1_G009939 [Lachnellula suecica]|uniref:Uncharacterized protein n=1 Tax=Lachnellula suecica TaxID=602035 RepID=A0A8T9BY40_9HELO|nr:hypothetical protein LSUE1_G009939 [Lachnellula suecica]